MISRFTSLILFFIIMCSCDPCYEEKILLINKTNQTLNLEIIQIVDSRMYDFEFDNREINFTSLKNDSNFTVKFDLLSGRSFYFWRAGGIGTISLKTKKDGEIQFNDICDSICFENCSLKKEIKDFNNWDFYIDTDHPGGGKAEYTFTITDNDIENK